MTANTEEKIELNEQTPLKSDTDAPATADPAPGEDSERTAETEQTGKKGFKLFNFTKANKNAKAEEGAVVAPSEKEKEAKPENKQPQEKKPHWWTKNCTKKTQDAEETVCLVNLIQRDSHGLQTAIDFTYEEVYGEPDNAHSINAIWKFNHAIFTCVRSFFYKVFSFIVALPLAIVFGVLFALTNVISVFFCIPTGRLLSIPANWIFKVWSFIVSGIFDPIFHAIGNCFGNVKISRYGINTDVTSALA